LAREADLEILERFRRPGESGLPGGEPQEAATTLRIMGPLGSERFGFRISLPGDEVAVSKRRERDVPAPQLRMHQLEAASPISTSFTIRGVTRSAAGVLDIGVRTRRRGSPGSPARRCPDTRDPVGQAVAAFVNASQSR